MIRPPIRHRELKRKGQVFVDILVIGVILFILVFLGFLASKMWRGIDTGIQANINDATAKTASSGSQTGIDYGVNIAIAVALAFCYIGLFITTRSIASNPMFFFFNLFAIVVVIGVSAIYANVFDSATNNPNWVTERAAMPIPVFIMNHLLEFTILAAFIALVGFFAKPSDGGYQ